MAIHELLHRTGPWARPAGPRRRAALSVHVPARIHKACGDAGVQPRMGERPPSKADIKRSGDTAPPEGPILAELTASALPASAVSDFPAESSGVPVPVDMTVCGLEPLLLLSHGYLK